MSALDLIARLRELGIRISAVDGEIQLDAPGGALTEELRNEIIARKPELLRLLSWSRRSGRSAAKPLQPVGRDQPLPLSWAQQRLWFLDQLEPGSSAYNISWTVRLRGELNQPALQAALNTLVARHETLRTCFPAEAGVPQQFIMSELQVAIEPEDQVGTGDEQLRARLAWLASQPFELATGPLLRVHLLQRSEQEHILLVLIHHIVSDGASMRVLFRELAACYEAELEQRPISLPDLPVQYADFSVWQRDWLDGEELERQTDYWCQRLEGLPPLLELPWDRPRARAMRYRGASVLRVIPAELADELRALGRGQGSTLFMVMLAAFYVLLMRYSGRKDLVVGTPMGGRPRSDLEGLIGFFINTVVLRADLDGDPSFTALLQSVRDIALEAHANQELPFEKLVEVLQPERELSYSPVFQVMFDLQEEPRWRLPVRNLEVVPEVVFSSRTSSFDLTLSVRQAENGLDAMFEYDTDLFDELTIERMALHYQQLLAAIVANPDNPLSALSLLEADERRQLIETWGERSAAYPDTHTLISLVEMQARIRPDALAVIAGERQCSYGELNRRANRLAFRLQSLGIEPGQSVALCAPRSINTLAATLAILKCGACVVPLDANYPHARLEGMLTDSGAQLLLTASQALTAGECQVLELDEGLFVTPDYPDEDTQLTADPDSLAFLLFTSGSTGRPKAVELNHRGLVNYLHHLGEKTELTPADRVLQFASLSFDISIEESFAALTHGAALVLREEGMQESLDKFSEVCARQSVSWVSVPTAWWHEWCAGLAMASVSLPEKLRSVVIGGEKAQRSAFTAWNRAVGDRSVRLFNTYGPTETSIVATWCELTHEDPLAPADLPIGHPVPNVRAWVLDEHLQPLPPGVPGELYIGGLGVARGYRQQAELTRQQFVPDPLSPDPAARLYRTGDRARYLPDGRLMFMGRVDEQVKLRGHRVEPGEIEAVLASQPGVEQSAVVLSTDRLVAYVAGDADTDRLRQQLAELLPDYMVPTAWVSLDALPLTPNGKLNRQALPAPVITADEQYVAPRNDIEAELASIWREVLGAERVGVHDDFFALGGHSLIATRVVARVRDVLSQNLPLRALFNHPTVAGLAALIAAGETESETVPLQSRPVGETLPPLSWAQERLWFLDQLEPDSTAYHLPWSARLKGKLHGDALQQAVDALVNRHESLRTVFAVSEGEPVQLISESVAIRVAEEQLTDGSHEAIDRRLLELVSVPFDLHSGPLLRVHVLRLSDDEAVLLLVMHHIVSDGWSMGVLFNELAALYDAAVQGQPAELAELPVQYADYAVWQRQWLSGVELDRQVSYWSQQLQDAPPLLELPLDHPRPPVQRYRGAWVNQTFSPELLTSLRQLAAAEGCTLFMVLLAAFKVLLARHTGVEDLVVGTPIAGRRRTELEGLIGFFLNTLALRTDLSGNPDFAEVLQRVKTTTLDAYDHQELPFEKLLEVLQPMRSTAHTPVVQVMFNLHNEPSSGLSLAGLAVNPFSVDRGTAKFDLSVALVEGSSGLQAGFEYNTDLFEKKTMECLLADFEQLLLELTRQPQQGIAEVSFRQTVTKALPEAASISAPVQDDGTLVEMFAGVVERYADAPAVMIEAEILTYAELDGHSNALAWLLEECAGERVGLVLGHDANMLVGLLGVLKAGAAYVPLDPEAPASRLQQIVAEADIRVVVSDPAHAIVADQLQSTELVLMPDVSRDSAPDVSIEPENLAYVLFTSGSTGTPKGVMQTHRNVLQHARTYSESLSLSSTDKLSLLSGFGFDAAVMDIYAALTAGACLCPVSLRDAADPLVRLQKAGVTIYHSTPTVLRYLFSESGRRLSTARALVLGGEEAQAADFEIFKSCFPEDALFINGLGPSECTLALQFHADRNTRLPGSVVPVGLPVNGVDVCLQDADGAESKLAGELVYKSRFLSTGYLGQDDLTRARFITDRHDPAQKVFRTGDRARYLPDGQLVFMGRVDDQVKLAGHRIEPGEIEGVIRQHEGVEQCAVVLRDERLVAYIVGAYTRDGLRAALAECLPEYMLPAAFVGLDELPLTPNGKLNKAELPAPVMAVAAAVYTEPRNAAEAELASIWSEVLGVERVGIHDDFFALGGHSLMATRVVARVRDALGQSLPLRALFNQPTVAGLAALIAAGESDSATAPLQPRPVGGELPPLSWAQQRLWFLDQLEPDSAAYSLHWAARLTGHFKLEALQLAVTRLVARHESLRTRFVSHAGEPVQLIMPQTEVRVVHEALQGVSEDRLQARLLNLIRVPFDLQAGPLLRVHVLRLSDDEAVLLLVMHHIVSDGWSMGVLFRELAALYDAAVQGQPAQLPDLPVQYADYAVWQRQWLSGVELDRQVSYWSQQLQDVPPLLELPLDHPRPPVQRYRGAWVNQTFSPELLSSLRELAAAEGCTLFMVLLAAFKVLLARHTGVEDLVVGTPIAGRRRTELEGLIGFFLNTLALRTDVSGNPDFAEVLQRVKTTTLDAYDHQELPFEKLLEVLQPLRSTAHTPVVQVMFNLHNEPSSGLSLAGLVVDPFSVDRGTAKFDLSVALVEGSSGLQAGFEYNTDLFEKETVELLLRHYGELLWAIARNPTQRVSRYPLTSSVTAPQRKAITHERISSEQTLAAAFSQAVQRFSDCPAVVTLTDTWTYAELDARANAIAWSLQADEVNRVGLLLGHDADMLAGILGVLKAGAAYVPLDPGAPVSRLQQIVDEAGLSRVVTNSQYADMTISLQGVTPIVAGDKQQNEAPPVVGEPDDMAYILFTSGSTGKPKGVTQSQRNVLWHVANYSEALSLSEGDRLTLLSSYGFDAAVMDIFGALLNGGCLYPMSLKEEEYTGELLDRMGEHRITVLHATPTVFRHLMRNKVCRHDLSCVRFVVLGGEEALANDFALFRKQFAPPTLFVNGLGPSECTLALQFFADHGTRLPGSAVPVGRPVNGVEVQLVDADGADAGLIGELVFVSRYVSAGYWQQDELTRQRFKPDPQDPNRFIYRTGDRARYLPDGQLVFIGRVDDQVKVRGHRIEPGDIETAAMTLDAVERCAVVLHEERLVAYIVGAVDASQLREKLRSLLPEYMVPAAFVVLDELPLTPNGKLDKKSLPVPALGRDEGEAYVAPRNEIEQRLAAIWSEVLGVERIGVYDDFFALGGHSLMAAQLVARITDTLQVGLPIRRLFDSPTVAGIAEYVETLRWALEADDKDAEGQTDDPANKR